MAQGSNAAPEAGQSRAPGAGTDNSLPGSEPDRSVARKSWRREGMPPALRFATATLLQSFVLTTASITILRFAALAEIALRNPTLLPLDAWLVLTERPAELAILALAVLVACWRRQKDTEWWLLASGILVAALVWESSSRIVADPLGSVVPLLTGLATWGAAAAYRRFVRDEAMSFAAMEAMTVLLLVIGLVSMPHLGSPSANRLGLVAGTANTTEVRDYSGHPLKDDYPPITIRSNSLGYRDIEPEPQRSNRTRVLVVGDSFVWGDGIASGDDTLPGLLRRNLEEGAPGRYDVTSAAYPGLGVHGYRRAVEAMIPEVHPDLIVVGYLGTADLVPLDGQNLADLLRSQGWLAHALISLRTLQNLHESSATAPQDAPWLSELGTTSRTRLFDTLRDFVQAPGHRAILLCYFGEEPTLQGLDALVLPAKWRYQGHRSELWYAKDCHPKPALNRLLATWLASEILHPNSAQGDRALNGEGGTPKEPAVPGVAEEPKASADGSTTEPVIPPSQEPLILAMLGGSSAVQGCVLLTAEVQKSTIEASYDCGGGSLRAATLRHPSASRGGSVLTEQFALDASSPQVPQAFLEAVAAGVRSRESEFRWNLARKITSAQPTSRPALGASATADRGRWRPIAIGAFALLLVLSSWRRRPVSRSQSAPGTQGNP